MKTNMELPQSDTVDASKEEPQYLIKSDETDHMAMLKGSALRKTAKSEG